ncbi:MAG: protoporphyrinogen oxidase [Balneolales bacterium]
MSVAIIGAGISGLSLALELRKRGIEVKVYESSDQVGGVIKTYRDKNWLVELGPNSILKSSTRIGDLIDDLNLTKDIIYTNKAAEKRYVVLNGKPEAVPGSAMAFIKSKLLSTKGKFMIMKEPLIKPKPGDDDESLADFVRRRLGKEILDCFIYPLVGGIYAGDPEKLSVKYAFKNFYKIEKKYGSIILGQLKASKERESHEIAKNKALSISFREGLQSLPEAISRKLDKDVILNTRVLSVTNQNGTFQLETDGTQNVPEMKHHDAVVYAGAAHGLNKIKFTGNGKTNPEVLADITYPAVCSVALGFRKEQIKHPLDGFGVLIPPDEGYRILGTQFNSTVFTDRTPDKNHVLLTTFIGGTRFPEAIHLDDNELLKVITDDLNRLLGLEGDADFVNIARWPKAIPQYEVGYGRYMDAMDTIERENPGFYLAGNYRTGIAIADCISSTVDLGDRIESDLLSQKKLKPIAKQ